MHLQITSSESGGMDVIVDGKYKYGFAIDDALKPNVERLINQRKPGQALNYLKTRSSQEWRIEG